MMYNADDVHFVGF